MIDGQDSDYRSGSGSGSGNGSGWSEMIL